MNILKTITSIWNNFSDEERRRDLSHWRGCGRWQDDARWLKIGQNTLKDVEKVWRFVSRRKAELKDLAVLEWGPGGGSNAIALKGIAKYYYGVDISKENLKEAGRQCAKEVEGEYFKPVLLSGYPGSIVNVVPQEIDLFISTAVFQHFPSR